MALSKTALHEIDIIVTAITIISSNLKSNHQNNSGSLKHMVLSKRDKRQKTKKQERTYQVSISSTLNVRIFCTNVHFGSFYYVYVTRKKLPKRTFIRKTCAIKLMKLTADVL